MISRTSTDVTVFVPRETFKSGFRTIALVAILLMDVRRALPVAEFPGVSFSACLRLVVVKISK